MLDRDDLYVQLGDDVPSGDDEATGDASAHAQWARFDQDELVGVESRSNQVLLHDPYPMLQALQDATIDVREGTPIAATDSDGDRVEEEGATSGEDGSVDDGLADQPDIAATVDLTETDQSALEALSKQIRSDELDIQVWVEPAVADGDVDEAADGSGEQDEVDWTSCARCSAAKARACSPPPPLRPPPTTTSTTARAPTADRAQRALDAASARTRGRVLT